MVLSATSVLLPAPGVSPLLVPWESLSLARTCIRSTIMLALMMPPSAIWTRAMNTLVKEEVVSIEVMTMKRIIDLTSVHMQSPTSMVIHSTLLDRAAACTLPRITPAPQLTRPR